MKNKLYRRKLPIALITLLILLMSSITIFATGIDGRSGTEVTVKADEVIDSSAMYTGQNITVDGKINGTTFLAGDTVVVNGEIDGDLFIAGRIVDIKGKVNGNIFSAGSAVYLKGEVTRDSFITGQTVGLGSESKLGRDVFIGGQTISMDGSVMRNANIAGETINHGDKLKITGNLNATSTKDVNDSLKSKVEGKYNYKKDVANTAPQKPTLAGIIMGAVVSIVGGLLIWLLFKIIKPIFWVSMADTVDRSMLKSMGIGLLAWIVVPIVSIILMITIVGIPVAIILFIALIALFMISKIIVSEYIGQKIIKKRELHYGIWNFLLGFVILTAISYIPYIGVLISALVILVGTGAAILKLYEDRKVNKIV